jgi:hypothetical protein
MILSRAKHRFVMLTILVMSVSAPIFVITGGPLTQGISSAIGHVLFPADANSLDLHESTLLERHMFPFELLLLFGVTWWVLNRIYKHEAMTVLRDLKTEPRSSSLK